MIPESVPGDPRRRHRRARQAGRRRHPRALDRRGRSHPGRQDRVQGQGQQAHPPRGRRRVTPGRANLDVLRGRAAGLRRPGRGLLRRRRLGVPRRRWPTRCSASGMVAVTAVSPSLAAAERADASAFAAEWGFRQVEVETDELERAAYRVNDGDRCFWCKDALMDAVGPIAAELGGRRSCSASTSTTSATTGPGSGCGRSGARCSRSSTPASPRPTCEPPSREARPAHVGQAGGAVPRVAGAVRHAGHRRPARRGSSGPRPACAPSGSASCGCATTATPARVEVPVDDLAARRRRSAMPWWPRCTAPATAGSTLDLEGLRSGNLNADLPR